MAIPDAVAAGWRLDEVPELRGRTLEWTGPEGEVVSERDRLELRPPGDATARTLGHVPAPAWRAAAARLRLAQRALRFQVTNVVPLSDGTWFVGFDREVGVLRDGAFHVLAGRDAPSRILRGGCAVDARGGVVFGEYFANPDRRAVRVHRHEPGERSVEVVHEFAAGTVRHVHGVFRDPTDGSLWCTTGDRGSECGIHRTDDGFRSLDTVGSGDETWRAVSLQFTDEAVYYGTDAEHGRNRVHRLDRASGRRDELGEVDGPVYYSRSTAHGPFFGVTAEPCPSQVSGCATLWRVTPDDALERVARFPKDRWSARLFLPGLLHFAAGPGPAEGERELIVHCVALDGVDGRAFRVSREDAA